MRLPENDEGRLMAPPDDSPVSPREEETPGRMTTESDDAGVWELAGSFRAAPTAQRWTFLGGWEEPDALGLRFVVHHPDDPELIRRVEVKIPITADGADLVIGEAEPV